MSKATSKQIVASTELEELRFWQFCYAAAISAGPFNASNGNARMAADQGVRDLRQKLGGASTPANDCVSRPTTVTVPPAPSITVS